MNPPGSASPERPHHGDRWFIGSRGCADHGSASRRLMHRRGHQHPHPPVRHWRVYRLYFVPKRTIAVRWCLIPVMVIVRVYRAFWSVITSRASPFGFAIAYFCPVSGSNDGSMGRQDEWFRWEYQWSL